MFPTMRMSGAATKKYFLSKFKTLSCGSTANSQKYRNKIRDAVQNDDGRFVTDAIFDAVVIAVLCDATETVELFLKCNKDLVHRDNEHCDTLLIVAVQYNRDCEIIKHLIAAGADVNRVAGLGQIPLYVAVNREHEEMVTLLISAGAKVDKSDKCGRTSLLRAAQKGHTGIVSKLLVAGADINKADEDGYTALFCAAWGGHVDTFLRLLEAGGKINPHFMSKVNLRNGLLLFA